MAYLCVDFEFQVTFNFQSILVIQDLNKWTPLARSELFHPPSLKSNTWAEWSQVSVPELNRSVTRIPSYLRIPMSLRETERPLGKKWKSKKNMLLFFSMAILLRLLLSHRIIFSVTNYGSLVHQVSKLRYTDRLTSVALNWLIERAENLFSKVDRQIWRRKTERKSFRKVGRRRGINNPFQV